MKYLSLAGAVLLAVSPVQAADLGGNCCADLEERVAELEATTARKGNRKVFLRVYGHVNEAVLWFQGADGINPVDARVIPATQSQTRFGFKGTVKMTPQWSAGFLLEVGAGAIKLDERSRSTVINRDLTIRHSALYIKSKSVGAIWLGRTSMASDGAAEMDLSKSSTAGYMLSLAPIDSAFVGVSVLAFDGTRRDVIKYVSPVVSGFTLSAAWSDEDTYDVALRYAGEFGSIRLAGAAAYRRDMGPSDGPLVVDAETNTYVASASLQEIKTGLFASGAYGHQEVDGLGKAVGFELRAGIELKAGEGATLTPYGRYMQIKLDDIKAGELWGGGVVWSYGVVDVYASYTSISVEGLDDDIQAGLVGAKLKF